MRFDKRKMLVLLKPLFLLGTLTILCVYLGFRNVRAAVDVLPWTTPTATATRRPPPLQPIPASSPTRPMWVAQGEIEFNNNNFVCRARCEQSWVGVEFEGLQATRGTEDWISLEGERVRCYEEGDGSGRWYLRVGSWVTAAHSPEDTLCFLVINESRQLP